MGHSRRFRDVCDESGLAPTPDTLRHRGEPPLRARNRHFWQVIRQADVRPLETMRSVTGVGYNFSAFITTEAVSLKSLAAGLSDRLPSVKRPIGSRVVRMSTATAVSNGCF